MESTSFEKSSRAAGQQKDPSHVDLWKRLVNMFMGDLRKHGRWVVHHARTGLEKELLVQNHFNQVWGRVRAQAKAYDAHSLLEPYAGVRNLSAGWDDEDAEPISEETWQRAEDTVTQLLAAAKKKGRTLLPPQLMPASSGNLHLFWEFEDKYALIVVPTDSSKLPRWYVRTRQGEAPPPANLPTDSVSEWLLIHITS